MADPMFSKIISGLGFGATVALSPGPVLALVISDSIRSGVSAGALVSLSTSIATVPVLLASLVLARSGISGSSHFTQILAIIGAAFLIYCARDAWRPFNLHVAATSGRSKSFVKGFTSTIFSPYPYTFWVTVGIPASIYGSLNWKYSVGSFATGFSIAMFFCNVAVGIGCVVLGRRFGLKWVGVLLRVSSVVLVLFAVRVVVGSFYL
jgi:threonine/homoserine/homoserine lactone efflux protein